MKLSKLKKLPREKELEKIRRKIIEAIRYSERYWLIFRENTFGLATIIDLVYKKSYIEVLFFPNKDVMKRGVPLLKVNTPIETEVDLDEIVLDPDFDEEDGLVSPMKIIKRDVLIFIEHLSFIEKNDCIPGIPNWISIFKIE